jgi:fructose-1,6-bisphosphatase/inositol monophosphatase family enzyme
MLENPDRIVERLRELQRHIRHAVIAAHDAVDLSRVHRVSTADTIYGIDAVIEPVIEQYLEEWGREQPLVLIAEGIEPETGRVFPAGAKEAEAKIRLLVDPVDGTRGLMYDKRAAWSLAGAAPNKGPQTRLRDIEVAAMTELPTSKMGQGDVLWAIRGKGAHAAREVLSGTLVTPASVPHLIEHSNATSIQHGFAMISNFFPGTKVLASQLMEHLIANLIGPADVTAATVFEDQYISTGGQFYELIVGHDRFNADLRPLFYKIQGQPEGLCCHPYDCATLLIAEEAGVVITDGLGNPLDSPMDVTTGLSWAGFANSDLRQSIEPLLTAFLRERGA